MANTDDPKESAAPETFAQVTPKAPRSYDEMNTGLMVFELQGTVGEIKQAIHNLTKSVEKGFQRIENLERTSGDIKEVLRQLEPKLSDMAGFVKHKAP